MTHPPQDAILLYVDGELPYVQEAEIREHLTCCTECNARMEELCSTLHGVANLYREESEQIETGVIREHLLQDLVQRRHGSRYRTFSIAAGLFLVTTLGIYAGHRLLALHLAG